MSAPAQNIAIKKTLSSAANSLLVPKKSIQIQEEKREASDPETQQVLRQARDGDRSESISFEQFRHEI